MTPAILLLLTVSANAETVHLKDGSVVHGTINKADADMVEIQTQDGVLQIKKGRIENIDYATLNSTATPIERPALPGDWRELSNAEESHHCAEGMIWRYEQCYPAKPMFGAPSSPLEREEVPVPETRFYPSEKYRRQVHLPIVYFGFGGLSPRNKVDFTGSGGGSDNIEAVGSLLFVQLLEPVGEHFGAGLEISRGQKGGIDSMAVIPKGITTSASHFTDVLGIVRGNIGEWDALHMYLFGGLGVSFSHYTMTTRPQPGFSWLDTNSTEPRNMIDDNENDVVAVTGVGFEGWIYKDLFLLGIEGRWRYVPSLTFVPTLQGTRNGVNGLSGSFADIALSATVGFAFR